MNTTKDDIKRLYTTEELLPVKQFLLQSEFRHTTPEILHTVAHLIAKCSDDGYILMGKEYEILAPHGTSTETLRVKISYYVEKNYDDVRENIKRKYNYDIGIYFGVKTFIEQMALVYSIFVMPL